jgi:hypothetical protein
MMEQMAMQQGLPAPSPMEIPSIQLDPDIDNPMLRFRITKNWLISEAGRQAKMDNEGGYRNVLLYAKMCKQLMMPPSMAPAPNGAPNAEKPSQGSLREAPITGEENVATVQ